MRNLKIALTVLFLLPISLNAEEVKTQKQKLDFSKIGIYANDFDFRDFCDMNLGKISYCGENKDEKNLNSGVWEGKINIPTIYPFDRVSYSRPISEYIENTDKILSKLDLKNIYAVILNEENVDWNNGLAILNSLYDRTKKNSAVMVYQWMSPPDSAPPPKLRADGWVMDTYGDRKEIFRRKLMKHLVTGKPVINCIWASPAHAGFGDFSQMNPSSQEQVGICREFNVPMFFYAVDAKLGSPDVWLHSDDSEIARWREWFFKVLDEAHKVDTGNLPLESANYSTGSNIKIGGDEKNFYSYKEDFSDGKILDDATIEGFLNLRWDGEKEVLFIEPKESRNIKNGVNLIYHFFSDFEISEIESQISGQMKGFCGVNLALSSDGRHWEHINGKEGDRKKLQDFNIITKDTEFKGKEFYVKISGIVDKKEPSSISLDDFLVKACVASPEKREVLLNPDKEGKVFYEDNFQSQDYLHLSDITNKEEIIWAPGQIGISGKIGFANTVILKQKFISEKPLTNFKITMEGGANAPNCASFNKLAVSLDGKNKLLEETTEGKKVDGNGTCWEPLILDLSGEKRFSGIRELWVHIEMISASGTIAAPKLTNTINKLKVEAAAK